jgi:Cu/Ag efflux pump CusA
MDLSQAKVLTQFIEAGLDDLLTNIKHDIALEILGTVPEDESKRETLYNLSRALDAIKGKLQESVNETNNQE